MKLYGIFLLIFSFVHLNNFAAQKEEKKKSWQELVAEMTEYHQFSCPGGYVFVVYAAKGRIDILKQALDAQLPIESIGFGETALISAVESGKLETVRFLLDNKADPNRPAPGSGMTPLVRAVQKLSDQTYRNYKAIKTYEDIIDTLLEKKADPKAQIKHWEPAIELARELYHLWPIFKKHGYDVQPPQEE